MKVKPEDHPSVLNRAGLGARLKAAGYVLNTRGPSLLKDGSLDETVELEVTTEDGSEPSESKAAEVASMVRGDSGNDAPKSEDAPARVYVRGGKVYAEDESGNSLLLGTLTQ